MKLDTPVPYSEPVVVHNVDQVATYILRCSFLAHLYLERKQEKIVMDVLASMIYAWHVLDEMLVQEVKKTKRGAHLVARRREREENRQGNH